MLKDLITVGNINVENDRIAPGRHDSAVDKGTESIRRNDQARAAGSHPSDIYVRARAIYFRARRSNGSRAASIF